MQLIIIIIAVVTWNVQPTVATITCYNCNSVSSADCAAPSSWSDIATCTTTGSCTKFTGTMNNVAAVIRGCLDLISDNKCDSYSSPGQEGTMCYCTSNLCNNNGVATKTNVLLTTTTKIPGPGTTTKSPTIDNKGGSTSVAASTYPLSAGKLPMFIISSAAAIFVIIGGNFAG